MLMTGCKKWIVTFRQVGTFYEQAEEEDGHKTRPYNRE